AGDGAVDHAEVAEAVNAAACGNRPAAGARQIEAARDLVVGYRAVGHGQRPQVIVDAAAIDVGVDRRVRAAAAVGRLVVGEGAAGHRRRPRVVQAPAVAAGRVPVQGAIGQGELAGIADGATVADAENETVTAAARKAIGREVAGERAVRHGGRAVVE